MEEELKVDKVQEDDKQKEETPKAEEVLQPQKPLNESGNKDGGPVESTTGGIGEGKEEDKTKGTEEDKTKGTEGGKAEDGGNNTAGSGAGTTTSVEKLASDDLNVEMAQLMQNTMDGKRRGDDGKARGGEPFDKLEDLIKKKTGEKRRRGRRGKKEETKAQEEAKPTGSGPGGGKPAGSGPGGGSPAGAGPEQGDHAQDDTPQAVKKSVDELRGGQLYMAVVLARQLEKGGQNPMADNKFKRFFNSSTFNSTADKIKLAGALSGSASLMDATYKTSTVSQAVALVSNLVGLVTGIKTIVQKLKKFKTIKGKMNRVMSGIGLVSDFAMTISKAVGIAQSITVLSGKFQGVTKTVFKYLNAIVGSVAQASGFISGAHGLKQARGKLNMMKTLKNKRWEDIENTVLPKYSEAEEGEEEEDEEDSGESTTTSSAAQTAQEATGEGGKKKRLSLKQKREQAKQLKQSKKERRSLANMLLRREDVSDEDKDKLVGYIASCRMIGKIKSGIFMGISGLVANAIGLGTNIANGVSAGDSENKDAENTGNTMGIISGFVGSGITLAKMGIDKSNQKKQNNEEADMIKGRLWGLIHGLDDDKYGLKGISESLEAKPSPEKAEEAKGVVNKYKAVDGQLRGAFVDYGAVLKANSAEEFRKLLVSGI